MTFNITWSPNGVYIKFRGSVIAHDLIDANNYVISNAEFESIQYQIFDFLDIDEFKISSYDINIIGAMDKSQSNFKKEMKVAVLTQDDYVRELITEYDQIMSGSSWHTKIFSDYETAKVWAQDK